MNLSALIVAELAKSKSPDPAVVARRLMARMTIEERDAALADALVDRVRIQVTRERGHATEGRRAGRSRWEQVRERVCVAGSWKFLADCTSLDLRAMAAEYALRADEMRAKEREYCALADALDAAGVETVGDLGATDLVVAA